METMSALYTKADYDRLPEGFPAQLIEGCLVKEAAPTYEHQLLVGRLRDTLVPLVDPALVVVSPTDVVIDEHNVFQPDVVVLGAIPPLKSSDVGIPRIAFEVLSPSSATRDRVVKRERLLAAGVDEVWLLDPHEATIEIWDGSGMRRLVGDEVAASETLPGFRLEPAAFFAPPGPSR